MQTYAKLHATYWRDTSLLAHSWLRGADWLCGRGREQWDAVQQLARSQWSAGQSSGACAWFDPLVAEAVQSALAGVSWDRQLARLNEGASNWTLVHGDCWPGAGF